MSDNTNDNRSGKEFVEGTQFYRDRGASVVLRNAIIVFISIIILSCFALWAYVDSGARQAYKEARDIRNALRAVGTEYYGGMVSIYDPSSRDGMVRGAAERVAQLSGRSGKVTLYAWDDEHNMPLSFEYQKGSYIVVYTNSNEYGNSTLVMEGDFEVDYSFRILRFEAE